MRGRHCRRAARPALEPLEARELLTVASSTAARVARVRHLDHVFVGELRAIELKSQATPAQYLALRDDARAISAAAPAAAIDPRVADAEAIAVSLQLDRSTLGGWLGDRGWADVRSRLEANLDGLGVPKPLIDRTIADMKAVADSAGVTFDEYQAFSEAFDNLREGEATLPSGSGHFPDPSLYFTQHLRGFFRGGAAQRASDQTKLRVDLRAVLADSNATPADAAVLRRDAGLLEKLEAAVPSDTAGGFGDAYLAAFAGGAPSGQASATLRQVFLDGLGPTATRSLVSSVDTLIADIPAASRAVGASSDRLRMIVEDVGAVATDGGGSSLNPFKVQVVHGAQRTAIHGL